MKKILLLTLLLAAQVAEAQFLISEDEPVANKRKVAFKAVDATDLNTPETGITFDACIITINGVDASCAGTIAEIDSSNAPGQYTYQATTGEVATPGLGTLYITDAEVNPIDVSFQILPVSDGTAQSVTGTTLVMASAAAYGDNDLQFNNAVEVVNASTGAGQARCILANVGATDTLTVSTWTTTPTGTIKYRIIPAPGCGVLHKLNGMLQADDSLFTYTVDALQNAPAGEGGGGDFDCNTYFACAYPASPTVNTLGEGVKIAPRRD